MKAEVKRRFFAHGLTHESDIQLHYTSNATIFQHNNFMLQLITKTIARNQPSLHTTIRLAHRMDRPSNHQPRDGGRPPRHTGPRGPRKDYDPNVPTTQQVKPGTSVSIVLKEDQPTGREVQGVVQNLLSHGNHPRGIKVRLQDGRVGRVQRMAGDASMAPAPAIGVGAAGAVVTESTSAARKPAPRIMRMERDVRLDEADYPSLPPARSFADYLPAGFGGADAVAGRESPGLPGAATATCPICGVFEGDEVAVSRHVDEHLT